MKFHSQFAKCQEFTKSFLSATECAIVQLVSHGRIEAFNHSSPPKIASEAPAQPLNRSSWEQSSNSGPEKFLRRDIKAILLAKCPRRLTSPHYQHPTQIICPTALGCQPHKGIKGGVRDLRTQNYTFLAHWA